MSDASSQDLTRERLPFCGVYAALLFNLVVVGQALTRPGYDFMRLPLSLLALGDWGWVQTVNFMASGLLVIASAFGVRGVLRSGVGRLSGPLFVALYGTGMALAGMFPSDAENGFPIGAHRPESMSWHASLHGAAFLIAQVSILAACLIFAYRSIRLSQPGWAATSLGVALAGPLLVVLGFLTSRFGVSRFLRVVSSRWAGSPP